MVRLVCLGTSRITRVVPREAGDGPERAPCQARRDSPGLGPAACALERRCSAPQGECRSSDTSELPFLLSVPSRRVQRRRRRVWTALAFALSLALWWLVYRATRATGALGFDFDFEATHAVAAVRNAHRVDHRVSRYALQQLEAPFRILLAAPEALDFRDQDANAAGEGRHATARRCELPAGKVSVCWPG